MNELRKNNSENPHNIRQLFKNQTLTVSFKQSNKSLTLLKFTAMRIILLLFTMLLIACATEDFTESEPQVEEEEEIEKEVVEKYCPIEHEKSEIEEPLQRRWKLVGFVEDGEDEIIYPPCIGYELYQPGYNYPFMMHLEFTDKPYELENFTCTECFWFSGFGGVNLLSGIYQYDKNNGSFKISVGHTFAGSLPELLDFEVKYLDNLYRTFSYSLDGNELYLYYEDGKMLYTPTDVEPAGIE